MIMISSDSDKPQNDRQVELTATPMSSPLPSASSRSAERQGIRDTGSLLTLNASKQTTPVKSSTSQLEVPQKFSTPEVPRVESNGLDFMFDIDLEDGYQKKADTPIEMDQFGLSHPRDPVTAEQNTLKPSSAIKSVLKRFSLAPSETSEPDTFLDQDGKPYDKSDRIIGFRRKSRPPTVPPKPYTLPEPSDTRNTNRLSANSRASGDSSRRSNRFSWPATALEQAAPPPPEVQPQWKDLNMEAQNGRTAWLHAFTGMLMILCCWGMGNSFGLFQAYYEAIYPNTPSSTISWIGSTQLALVLGSGVPVGRLVDMGYFRLCFNGGSAIMLIGVLATAYCRSILALWFTQGLITGIGMGMVFCSGAVALMTWFDETKIASAMGLCAAGSSLGGIVYVLIARHFLFVSGFRTTMLIYLGLNTALTIPGNIVFRLRDATHRRRARERSASSGRPQVALWRTFSAPSYMLAAGGMFFAFLGVYFGFVYIVLFGHKVYQLSNTASTNLLIAMLAANLPGRFLPALISERCIGPLNTMIPSLFLSSAVIGLWIGLSSSSTRNVGALFVIACFYGFASAGIQVLYTPTVYAFCMEPAPEKPPLLSMTPSTSLESNEARQTRRLTADRLGVKAGGIFTCIGLACLIGTPIGGALIKYRTDRDLDQPFLGAQVFAATALALGGLFLLGSRIAKVGWEARRA